MADKWIQLMSEDGTDNLFPTSRLELLWTNSSPTSSFAAQTISLDLSDYAYVVIKMGVDTANLDHVCNFIALIDGGATRCEFSSRVIMFRDATVTTSGVSFGVNATVSSYNGTVNNTNTNSIPLYIYGVK